MSRGRFTKRDLFGGRGEVVIEDLLGAGRLAPFEAVLRCELEPGGVVGDHHQAHFPELVIVLAGRGALSVNGAQQELGPGGVARVPLGATLRIENASQSEPLSYLIVKAKAP